MSAGQGGPDTSAGPLPAEVAFLLAHGADPAVLGDAAEVALRTGVTADRVLLGEGRLSAAAFYRMLARHLGVPYLEAPLPADPRLRLDRASGVEIVRLAPNPHGLDYALAPRGRSLALLLDQVAAGTWDGRGRVAVTTPQRLAALLRRTHRDRLGADASHALPDWNPSLSARGGPRAAQVAGGVAAGLGIAAGAWVAPWQAAALLGFAASAFFFGMVAVRLAASVASCGEFRDRASPPRWPDTDLPVYTVVVPLFREAEVVPRLVRALRRLDYPAAKLDIKVVVEARDRPTRAALERERLPDRFEILAAPPGAPQTKPRALNVALRFALGRHLVVFDAEDEPEPGQLRLAVAAFAAADERLGCLQGRLAIDNGGDGWLEALFALEYAALFDVINPGLARLGLPIPLGGSSNHFRTDALRALSGWDAWNVTEDVDLGIRLARFGYRTAMLPSTTFEEAPRGARAWLNQRRRWHKGWMVTLMTHGRDLDRLFGDLGPVHAVAVLSLLVGTVATALLGPAFALLVLVDAARGSLFAPATSLQAAASTFVMQLAAAGVAGLLLPMLLGLRRRGLHRFARRLALLPAYLALASLATWQALFDLVRQPYSWDKTQHGTARHRGPT